MKKFLLIFFFSLTLLYCSGWHSEKNNAEQLHQRCERYEETLSGLQVKESLIWKYSTVLPEEFLKECYPDEKNLDTLRAKLYRQYQSLNDSL